MRRGIRPALAAVVLAATALVALGVGQGSPPARAHLSAGAPQRERAALVTGGTVVREGEHAFKSAGCAACHTIAAGGYGGRLGPRLDGPFLDEPSSAIAKDVVDPPRDIPGYEAGLMPENFASRLSGHELRALAAYVHAVAAAATR